MPAPIVGTGELRAMFGGISRARVDQIVKKDDFPVPVHRQIAGNFWLKSDVVRWAKKHGRTIH